MALKRAQDGSMGNDSSELKVTSIDAYQGGRFIVHFSDDTYVAISAHELAKRFPERIPFHKSMTRDAGTSGQPPLLP